MPHPVDRAAEIIAQEWATFSNRDLCGHEISLARALYRAGALTPGPEWMSDLRDTLDSVEFDAVDKLEIIHEMMPDDPHPETS